MTEKRKRGRKERKRKVFNAEKRKVESKREKISVESEWSAAEKTHWTLVLIDLFFGFSL